MGTPTDGAKSAISTTVKGFNKKNCHAEARAFPEQGQRKMRGESMADEFLVKLLKESPKKFNQWRVNNPNTEIDLEKADLSNAHLKGANLSNMNFNSSNLSNAYLNDANLSGTDLTSSILYGVTFKISKLQQKNFEKAIISDTYLPILIYPKRRD
jgi:uncharacterized protein YjbI with pentapeptide repeats